MTALAGIRVVELAGLVPGPFGCMMLADLGADVVQVSRPESRVVPVGPLDRGRRTVTLDLKTPSGVSSLLSLVSRADVLVEGFRPGVAERLGFGPSVCSAMNSRLVYARMTGWGQDGPLASRAGHDIDYIAVSGALDPLGHAGSPPPAPLNYLGDLAGGGMLLAVGVLAALVSREHTGRGQVVDAAMVDGAGLLTAFLHGAMASGIWTGPRGSNLLDGGAPFYDTYSTADGQYVAVGAIEPQFYAALLRGLGLDSDPSLPGQHDVAGWPVLRSRFATAFATRTRDEWAEVFDAVDACVAPVLSPSEAPDHPHMKSRSSFVTVDGVTQPAPAPRFSRTPAAPPSPPVATTVDAVLDSWPRPQIEI
ncbi:CaiB/BaiF CoA transferase family protein [Actinoplanes sp. NPDC051343]|uniref:CaiB/BaiF CoA transferase family protein n=1 Tax=Actinoplanes sp. NPDC051343 TaxID=3363906 RepID=UPI00379AB192